MSCTVIPFRKSAVQIVVHRNHNGFSIDVPADLAGRIAASAIWVPKAPQQMALDTLEAAFPPLGGAA